MKNENVSCYLYLLVSLCHYQKHHSDPRGSDRLTETQMQVDDLKGIMVRNIGEEGGSGFNTTEVCSNSQRLASVYK